MREVIYKSWQIITILVVNLLWKLKIEGKDNIPATGGFIVATNHSSYLDILVIGCTMTRTPWFIGKRELFFWPFRSLFKRVSWIPLDRARIDRKALDNVSGKLAKGDVVAVFPEGTRNNGKKFGKAKAGIGMMLNRNNVKVLPAYIEGTSNILPKGSLCPRFFIPIKIVYGKPISYDELLEDKDILEEKPKPSIIYKMISEEIMARIATLRTIGG